jgi:hypothetical protein
MLKSFNNAVSPEDHDDDDQVDGWDYLSELQLPTGLLFLSQLIYEHG